MLSMNPALFADNSSLLDIHYLVEQLKFELFVQLSSKEFGRSNC